MILIKATYRFHIYVKEGELRVGRISVAPHVDADRSGYAEELGSSF